MKDQRGVKELQELISDTGATILTATEECNTSWQEAEQAAIASSQTPPTRPCR